MGGTLLIDVVVRQTTVLLATLATATGNRAPLAHVASEVFLRLVEELKAQGVSNKVVADMFGMALRTYHDRVARLTESQSIAGQSVWEAVLRFVQERGPVVHGDVLSRFRRDDDAVLRSVLRDLVSSRLVFRSGEGDRRVYRAASAEEQQAGALAEEEIARTLLLVAIHRAGPSTREAIGNLVPLAAGELDPLLEGLVADGRLAREMRDGIVLYRHDRVYISYRDPAGWEAAVFDHYQAVVSAICAKLRAGRTHAEQGEVMGGSTYHLDIWDGHPLEREVEGFLASVRRQAVALRESVERHNERHAKPEGAGGKRVTAYVGQGVIREEEENDVDA